MNTYSDRDEGAEYRLHQISLRLSHFSENHIRILQVVDLIGKLNRIDQGQSSEYYHYDNVSN